ncbi:hypothetical protein CKAH01_04668 [Colletotrichum kahawae]|uniref:Uncharacterized protein n=1 Tax=Colletotrichum kahawae TaxID=34407 RepID=A0AAD9YIZ0_COLKA|nr:hypothetical protein CKAH01_04668 [Colletotrichum kahawae]
MMRRRRRGASGGGGGGQRGTQAGKAGSYGMVSEGAQGKPAGRQGQGGPAQRGGTPRRSGECRARQRETPAAAAAANRGVQADVDSNLPKSEEAGRQTTRDGRIEEKIDVDGLRSGGDVMLRGAYASRRDGSGRAASNADYGFDLDLGDGEGRLL